MWDSSFNKIIYLNREGYDPFIDLMKAYAIICVVLAHALPSFVLDIIQFKMWGDMQVPLFLLIQTFHCYKKGSQPRFGVKKILKRIFLPYVFIQIVIILGLLVYKGLFNTPLLDFSLADFIKSGGIGPGSYYVWVYLQMALLLPLLWHVFNRFNLKQLLAIFIGLCIVLDIVMSIFNMPEWLYRLTAIRYLFLAYLGMIWVKNGIVLNIKTLILSIVTIGITVFFNYTSLNLEPVFFTTGWKTHRWVCYFYVSCILCFALKWIYNIIIKNGYLNGLMEEIGRSSYEIYLIQMVVFIFIPPIMCVCVGNPVIRLAIMFPIEVFLSIWLGIVFRKRIVLKLAENNRKQRNQS